jgi:Protein of unknown function (DUF4089)
MSPEQIETLADAASAAVQLEIAPTHRPGVLQYLALAASYAELLNTVPLTNADEPGSVFIPVSPSAVEDACR